MTLTILPAYMYMAAVAFFRNSPASPRRIWGGYGASFDDLMDGDELCLLIEDQIVTLSADELVPFTEDMDEIAKIMREEALRSRRPGAYHRPITAFNNNEKHLPPVWQSRIFPVHERKPQERRGPTKAELEDQWRETLERYPFDKLEPACDAPDEGYRTLKGPSFFIPFDPLLERREALRVAVGLVTRANKRLEPSRFTYFQMLHTVGRKDIAGIRVWRMPVPTK